MDWEQKYLEQLEKDIAELKQQVQSVEDNVDDKINQLLSNIEILTKSRHDDYLAVNKRLDHMSQKLDRTVTWTIRFSLGTFIGVASLIVTFLFKFY